MYKHFRENHKFRKIFNKNTVTPSQQKSMARAKEYLKENRPEKKKKCNCTKKEKCPMNGVKQSS